MTPEVTIKCFYTCNACGINEAAVDVPARKPDEDIVKWTKFVLTTAIGNDHTRRSPHCMSETISTVKVPISDEVIGGAEVQ